MKLRTALLAVTASATFGFSALANAETIYMNYSNVFGNTGTNYAQVDITENAGNLLFTVQSLEPAGWWFDKFYFNLTGSVGTVSLTGLPSGWSADTNQNVSMFGLFSDGATGDGNSNYTTFSFTADSNVDLSLANLGPNGDGWVVAGHQKCGGKGHPECAPLYDEQEYRITSHFIAGAPTTVPVPAAAWLLGSALFGFMGYRRRSH